MKVLHHAAQLRTSWRPTARPAVSGFAGLPARTVRSETLSLFFLFRLFGLARSVGIAPTHHWLLAPARSRSVGGLAARWAGDGRDIVHRRAAQRAEAWFDVVCVASVLGVPMGFCSRASSAGMRLFMLAGCAVANLASPPSRWPHSKTQCTGTTVRQMREIMSHRVPPASLRCRRRARDGGRLPLPFIRPR